MENFPEPHKMLKKIQLSRHWPLVGAQGNKRSGIEE